MERKATSKFCSATIGFEAKLLNNMDAAECENVVLGLIKSPNIFH